MASLIQSPLQAENLVRHFTWQAPTGEQGVYRQFLPLLGWLATLNSHCREVLIEREPQALAFFGDLRNDKVPLATAKTALRESIRRLVVHGDRIGRGMFHLTSENYWQAGPTRLIPTLKTLFKEYGEHHLARDALLSIAMASRSDSLQSAVLRQHSNNYESLFQSSLDLRYILELGHVDDLVALAEALKTDKTINESSVATTITWLGWRYLTARDLAVLIDKQFDQGYGGFRVSYALDSGLVEDASDEQLYELTRSLVLRVARFRQRKGKPARPTLRVQDRYVELVTETLIELIRRHSFSKHKRIALLCLILGRVLTDGFFGISNSKYLRQVIMKNDGVRLNLLQLNVTRAANDDHKLWTSIYGYESFCEVMPGDVDALNSPQLRAVVSQFEKIQKAGKTQQKATRKVPNEKLKIKPAIKKELLGMLDSLRDGTETNALGWVAAWLLETNPNSRYGEVQFEVFEQEVGPKLAQAVRGGFAKIWRSREPVFSEINPRTTYYITAAGLQGLHLELANTSALALLTKAEVRKAIQYAVFEINGYPKWFWSLIELHQEVAIRELIKIVKQGKAGATSLEHAQEILISLENAPALVRTSIAPFAWEFIVKNSSLSDYVIDRLLSVATSVAGVVPQSEFQKTALLKIRNAFKEVMTDDERQAQIAQRKQSMLWAVNWLSAYPVAFCSAIKKWLIQAPTDARNFIFDFAAHLGAEHDGRTARLAQSGDDGVRALAELYEWTIEVVRPVDDVVHKDGEAYSPDKRDQAERLRDSIIPAIAEGKSQLAYEVLEKFCNAASGAREIYLRSVQFSMREFQFARPPLSQLKYNDFERDFTADITDTTSFAMRIHSDLLAVRYDIQHGEYSLRRFFTDVMLQKNPKNQLEADKEGIALEADFQRLLASELHHHSKSSYTVTVEPQTAEAKRRDVLCSKGNMFASIELKMSKRWTLDKYLEALERQLVGQYMRHRNATIGFLVIVLQEPDRTWIDTTTKKKLDFKALLELLADRALKLEAQDRRRYLRVIGIDATVPKNFRSTPNKSANLSKKRRSTSSPVK